eukprot:6197756-Pleurochrysis_carterae.AAC.2
MSCSRCGRSVPPGAGNNALCKRCLSKEQRANGGVEALAVALPASSSTVVTATNSGMKQDAVDSPKAMPVQSKARKEEKKSARGKRARESSDAHGSSNGAKRARHEEHTNG